jgi:hypothetical protein
MVVGTIMVNMDMEVMATDMATDTATDTVMATDMAIIMIMKPLSLVTIKNSSYLESLKRYSRTNNCIEWK